MIELFLKRYVLPALAGHYLTFILGLLFMLCYASPPRIDGFSVPGSLLERSSEQLIE